MYQEDMLKLLSHGFELEESMMELKQFIESDIELIAEDDNNKKLYEMSTQQLIENIKDECNFSKPKMTEEQRSSESSSPSHLKTEKWRLTDFYSKQQILQKELSELELELFRIRLRIKQKQQSQQIEVQATQKKDLYASTILASIDIFKQQSSELLQDLSTLQQQHLTLKEELESEDAIHKLNETLTNKMGQNNEEEVEQYNLKIEQLRNDQKKLLDEQESKNLVEKLNHLSLDKQELQNKIDNVRQKYKIVKNMVFFYQRGYVSNNLYENIDMLYQSHHLNMDLLIANMTIVITKNQKLKMQRQIQIVETFNLTKTITKNKKNCSDIRYKIQQKDAEIKLLRKQIQAAEELKDQIKDLQNYKVRLEKDIQCTQRNIYENQQEISNKSLKKLSKRESMLKSKKMSFASLFLFVYSIKQIKQLNVRGLSPNMSNQINSPIHRNTNLSFQQQDDNGLMEKVLNAKKKTSEYILKFREENQSLKGLQEVTKLQQKILAFFNQKNLYT